MCSAAWRHCLPSTAIARVQQVHRDQRVFRPRADVVATNVALFAVTTHDPAAVLTDGLIQWPDSPAQSERAVHGAAEIARRRVLPVETGGATPRRQLSVPRAGCP